MIEFKCLDGTLQNQRRSDMFGKMNFVRLFVLKYYYPIPTSDGKLQIQVISTPKKTASATIQNHVYFPTSEKLDQKCMES